MNDITGIYFDSLFGSYPLYFGDIRCLEDRYYSSYYEEEDGSNDEKGWN